MPALRLRTGASASVVATGRLRGSTSMRRRARIQPTSAAHGAASAKPPAARTNPVMIGPTAEPRLRALLLKASIVPAGGLGQLGHDGLHARYPEPGPEGPDREDGQRDRQGHGRHRQQQRGDDEAGDADEHGTTRPDPRDEPARQPRRDEPDDTDQDVDEAGLGGRDSVGHVDELTDVDEQPEAWPQAQRMVTRQRPEGTAVSEDRADGRAVARVRSTDPGTVAGSRRRSSRATIATRAMNGERRSPARHDRRPGRRWAGRAGWPAGTSRTGVAIMRARRSRSGEIAGGGEGGRHDDRRADPVDEPSREQEGQRRRDDTGARGER